MSDERFIWMDEQEQQVAAITRRLGLLRMDEDAEDIHDAVAEAFEALGAERLAWAYRCAVNAK